jgi:L-amino acid N-acyltransferase YncA
MDDRPVSGTVTVRAAEAADAAAIAEIYNQGIRGRMATFETEERSPAERAAWLASHDARHPVLVAVARSSGQVLGWVAASEYRSRPCYQGVAEFSVYVHEAARGQGVGRTLMDAFIPTCRDAGIWKLLSRVFLENCASRALCSYAGFREVGIYEKHARLDGVWKDTVIVERLIPENLQ